MSRSQQHLFSSRADIFREMAVAGGGLGLQQLQPPAAPVAKTAQEIRRANIDGHIWFEMLVEQPHPMAGNKYYACKVP